MQSTKAALNQDAQTLFQRGASKLEISLSSKTIDALLFYHTELLKWNQRINLIARETEERQIIELHFLDSLSLLLMLPKQNTSSSVHVLDVGTGAGFPGLALALAAPEWAFTLVEPRQKRLSFLRHIIRNLHLSNVELISHRLEDRIHTWPMGHFSHITSRALAEPDIFLPMVKPLLSSNTQVLLMLARRNTLTSLVFSPQSPWRILSEKALRLPFSSTPRLLVSLGYKHFSLE